MPEAPPLYLTHVPGRPYSQRYKYHDTLKDARAALRVRRYAAPETRYQIWEWIFNGQDGGRWVLVHDEAPGSATPQPTLW